MKQWLRNLAGLGAVLSYLIIPSISYAEVWPSKSIQLVIPFPAGGSMGENVARIVADKLTEELGQKVVIEYKPGAGGIVGSDTVAAAAPDGYTIGLVSDAHIILPHMQAKTTYDPLKDFKPITQLVRFPMILVANSSSGIKTVSDLINKAKANPGKLTYGSGVRYCSDCLEKTHS